MLSALNIILVYIFPVNKYSSPALFGWLHFLSQGSVFPNKNTKSSSSINLIKPSATSLRNAFTFQPLETKLSNQVVSQLFYLLWQNCLMPISHVLKMSEVENACGKGIYGKETHSKDTRHK